VRRLLLPFSVIALLCACSEEQPAPTNSCAEQQPGCTTNPDKPRKVACTTVGQTFARPDAGAECDLVHIASGTTVGGASTTKGEFCCPIAK